MLTHIFEQEAISYGKSHLCGICEKFFLQVLLSVEMKVNLKCMDYSGSKMLVFLFLTSPVAIYPYYAYFSIYFRVFTCFYIVDLNQCTHVTKII